MITDISNQQDQQLVANRTDLKSNVVNLLEEANFLDVKQLIEDLGKKKDNDIETNDTREEYMISKESADKLLNLFKKIGKNIDIFFQDFPADEFLPTFYQSMSDAQKRLGYDKLRPELRFELQPSAYSGFDDKFSQKDYQSLLFVLALLNYVDEKSLGTVLDGDKFVDAHKAMQLQKSADELALQQQPDFALTSKHAIFFKNATFALNVGTVLAGMTLIAKDLIKTENNEQKYRAELTNWTTESGQPYPKKSVYQSDSDNLLFHFILTMVSVINTAVDYLIGKKHSPDMEFSNYVGRGNNPNTNLLLFLTSLYVASHAVAETIVDKNIVKTMADDKDNEPFFQDDQALLYNLKWGLLVAGAYDKRYGIHNFADNVFNKISSLACGAINFARNLFHEKDRLTQPDKITPSEEDRKKIDEFATALVQLVVDARVNRGGQDDRDSRDIQSISPSSVPKSPVLKENKPRIQL